MKLLVLLSLLFSLNMAFSGELDADGNPVIEEGFSFESQEHLVDVDDGESCTKPVDAIEDTKAPASIPGVPEVLPSNAVKK